MHLSFFAFQIHHIIYIIQCLSFSDNIQYYSDLCCFKWQNFILFYGCVLSVCVCARAVYSVPKLFPTLCEFQLFPMDCSPPGSSGFSRQKYCIGLVFSTPRNLPDPVIECMSPVSPALAGKFFTTRVCEAYTHVYVCVYPRSIHLLMDTWLYDCQEVNIQNM